MAAAKSSIEVEGRRLKLKNRDKVLFPESGFTKGELIDFYREIGPVLIPHLRGRPLTLRRFPDGVAEGGFWEKRCPSYRPDWVPTVAVWSGQNEEEIDYCSADDLPTLLWIANLATIELHVSLSKAAKMERPTVLAFDLDPGPPADVIECCRIAVALRDLFDHLGMAAFPKTSGSKGLQVYVPLNSAVTYDDTKTFARALAQVFEERFPDLALSRMKRDLRKGKVFIDWSQNAAAKTTVAPYSLRAEPAPSVSTPLSWDEVERGGIGKFTPAQVLARVSEHGDWLAPLAGGGPPVPEPT